MVSRAWKVALGLSWRVAVARCRSTQLCSRQAARPKRAPRRGARFWRAMAALTNPWFLLGPLTFAAVAAWASVRR